MPVKVAAQVGVKNEAELIGPCIAHLRAIGVSDIYVHDAGSTDETLEVLKGLAGPDLTVLAHPIDMADLDKEAQMLATAREAQDRGADWYLMIDADEFLIPKGGDIRNVLPETGPPVIHMPRYNVVLDETGLTMRLPPLQGPYDGIRFYTKAGKWYRKELEADPTLAWLRFVPLPKAAVRPEKLGALVHGMHDAQDADRQPLDRDAPAQLFIAHVPLSSFSRFMRRIESIQEHFGVFAGAEGEEPSGFAWHWKRWIASARSGHLQEEFDQSVITQADLAELMAQEIVQTADQIFAALSEDNNTV